MQKTHILTLAAWLTLFIMPAIGQVEHIPVILKQPLNTPTSTILINSHIDAEIVFDTANFVAVRTTATHDQIRHLNFPEEQLILSSDGRTLTLSDNFPYHKGIEVHTTSHELLLTTNPSSSATLTSTIGPRVPLRTLQLIAHGGLIKAEPIFVVPEAHLSADQGGIILFDSIASPSLETSTDPSSHIAGHGIKKTPRHQPNEHYIVARARILPLFASLSAGMSSWSDAPFSGIGSWMGQYVMGIMPTGYLDFQVGYRYQPNAHWTFDIGYGILKQRFRAQNALLGFTETNQEGLLHLGPIDQPSYQDIPYTLAERTWITSMSTTYQMLVLRAGWRIRPGGFWARASVIPMFSFGNPFHDPLWLNQCAPPNNNRSYFTRDTRLSQLLNPLRCDLRLEIGWSALGLFVQGSLTPLFRTHIANNQIAIDQKIFPLNIGCSVNL